MHEKTFRDKIYKKLKLVPRGKVTTYKDLALAVGSRAYRAVGSVMKNNKDPENILCYKVIRSDGSVGNYSAKGGTEKKIAMLRKDGIERTVRQIQKNTSIYSVNAV